MIARNLRKAVFITPGIYPGGKARAAVEVRAQQNLAALAALGFAVTAVCTPDEHGRGDIGVPTVMMDALPTMDYVELTRRSDYQAGVRRVLAPHLADAKTVVLCEHIHAMACCSPHPRLVYSCHDLIFQLTRMRRIMSGRPTTLKTKLYWRYLEWQEGNLIRKAKRVISVSASEARKITERWHIPATYIPIVDREAPAAPAAGSFSGPVRFWFYGSSAATANKVMLDHLAAGFYNQLKVACPGAEFHQLGSYTTYAEDKIEWLKRNFTVHGFVEDPATVFRCGDICLIPYNYDTGFRTKVPELCAYGMIAAGYPATFACCPEMRNGYNCVIGATPDELADKLAKAAANETLRRRLSEGAYETRCRDFSFDALLEHYRRVLDFSP